MTTVLIADDALFMRTTLKDMFLEWGFEVVGEAANGKEAVELYETLQPDLVTMDLTMPVMSGIEAVKAIISKFPEAKIIMITAIGQQRIIVEAIESGAKDFITKPFEAIQVKKVVENVMDL